MQDWGSVVVSPKQVIFKHHSDFLQYKTITTLYLISLILQVLVDSFRKSMEMHLRKKAGK